MKQIEGPLESLKVVVHKHSEDVTKLEDEYKYTVDLINLINNNHTEMDSKKKASEEIVEKIKHDDIEKMNKKLMNLKRGYMNKILDIGNLKQNNVFLIGRGDIVIKREAAFISIQKKFALIMQKMKSVQKNTAEKNIHKHVDISLEGSAEEVHLTNI